MPADRRTTLLATAALLGVTAVWGSTFFLIHDLLTRVPTLDELRAFAGTEGAIEVRGTVDHSGTT